MGKIKCYCCRVPGCGLKFTSLGHRKRHETMYCKKDASHDKGYRAEEDGTFTCTTCGQNFERQCFVDKHVTVDGCTKVLSDAMSGAEDSDEEDRGGGDAPNQRSKLVEQSKKDGDKAVLNAKLYSCPTCGKKYFRKGHYIRHISTCINNPKYTAEVDRRDPDKIPIPVTTSQPLLSVLDMSLENFHAHVMSLLSPVGKPSPHSNNNSNGNSNPAGSNNSSVEPASPAEKHKPAL